MDRTRRELLGMAVAGGTGLLAGCAGSGRSAQETTKTTTAETMTEAQQTTTTERTDQQTDGYAVEVRTHPEHGVILTDAEGMTLYLFTQDKAGESVCYGDCAEAWPPLVVDGSPNIPDGLPGKFDTTERRDGSMQVTYGGMPLYYFVSDTAPGDATGQGVNDVWFVVNPSCGGAARATTTEGEGTAQTTTDDGPSY